MIDETQVAPRTAPMADMTAEQLAVYRAWASSGPKSCATPTQENEVQRGLLRALEAAEAQIAALTARLSGIDQLLADREVAVGQAVEFAEYVEKAAKGSMVERAKHFLSAPYAAELRARLSGMAAVQWQPIETAPRDGTEIVVCWPKVEIDDDCELTNKAVGYVRAVSSCTGGVWVEPEFFEANGPAFDDDWDFAMAPSHWMPLPAAPEVPGHG